MRARLSQATARGLERYLAGEGGHVRPPLRPTVAPGEWLATLDHTDGGWALRLRKWGFRPERWSRAPIINVRSATAVDKPMFRHALRERRCLVPVSGFFQWDPQEADRPFYFRRPDGAAFMLAGVWGTGEGGVEGCAVLTTVPNGLVQPFHDRMPSILEPEAALEWLTRPGVDEALAIAQMPASDDYLECYPVTARVNKAGYAKKDATEPVGPDGKPRDPLQPALFDWG